MVAILCSLQVSGIRTPACTFLLLTTQSSQNVPEYWRGSGTVYATSLSTALGAENDGGDCEAGVTPTEVSICYIGRPV